jgi:hypothetical protein
LIKSIAWLPTSNLSAWRTPNSVGVVRGRKTVLRQKNRAGAEKRLCCIRLLRRLPLGGNFKLDNSTAGAERAKRIHEMSIGHCLILVAALGAAGGLTACFHKDAVVLPRYDKRAKIWKPGAIGIVLVGAVAADLVWALYGPASSHDLLSATPQTFSLTLSQLAGSFVTGLGGGKILALMAQQKADQFTKGKLSKDIKTIVDTEDDAS